ncbi:hypothetical protein IEQ34_001923 [Dendrobium chrysotoxum]|uniref:Dof zinc finger protein n=1 Tax=Dendrobium chrysotoxum TaxID=161865 RepID=A0AAV7HI79_DENCH|nr:hypothetical protein IEQ34_001923 [Dendrobium chrysotoxum]
MAERARLAKIPQPEAALSCPRCDSNNTKFCYFNNYSLSQPRHFCKTCRRYWTRGGALRNVPVGGGCRRNKRGGKSSSLTSTTPPKLQPSKSPTSTTLHRRRQRTWCFSRRRRLCPCWRQRLGTSCKSTGFGAVEAALLGRNGGGGRDAGACTSCGGGDGRDVRNGFEQEILKDEMRNALFSIGVNELIMIYDSDLPRIWLDSYLFMSLIVVRFANMSRSKGPCPLVEFDLVAGSRGSVLVEIFGGNAPEINCYCKDIFEIPFVFSIALILPCKYVEGFGFWKRFVFLLFSYIEAASLLPLNFYMMYDRKMCDDGSPVLCMY